MTTSYQSPPFHRIHSTPTRFVFPKHDHEYWYPPQQYDKMTLPTPTLVQETTYTPRECTTPKRITTTTSAPTTPSTPITPTSTTSSSSLHITIPRMNSTPDCLVLSTHTPKRTYDEQLPLKCDTPTHARRASLPSTPSSRQQSPRQFNFLSTTQHEIATYTTSSCIVTLTPFQPCALSEAAQAACYHLPPLHEILAQQPTQPNRTVHPSLLPTMLRSQSTPTHYRLHTKHRNTSSLPCFPTQRRLWEQ